MTSLSRLSISLRILVRQQPSFPTCPCYFSTSTSSSFRTHSISSMPDEKRLTALFEAVERTFSQTSLESERWYIPATACLVYHDPESMAHLYNHLTRPGGPHTTREARQRMMARLREALFKSVILVGVCKPIEAILAIAGVERKEDRDAKGGLTRAGWQADEKNLEAARGWFGKVYQRNATDTLDKFQGHGDFAWLSEVVTYGLFLSDRQVLDDVDTQLVVLPAIASQNLPQESMWHIRGTRRIGVSKRDVGVLCDVVRLIAGFYGVKLDRVPDVEDVEAEV